LENMNKNKDLSCVERLEIKILLDKGYSMRAIALSMNRGKSTISYEIQGNSTNGEYDPLKADNKARLRKRMRKLQWSKIEETPALKVFIVLKLIARWNPDEVAGYLKRHRKKYPWYVSKTAIYDWLRTSRGERYCCYLYSKRKRIKKRGKKVERVLIPNRVSIHERFKGADNRTRYGHWEADTVMGKKNTPGGVKTAQERKTRLYQVKKVQSMRPKEHTEVLEEIISPFKVVSITFDNGIENRNHEHHRISTFFSDPYSSCQKGAIENGNKMFRAFFPKKTDFSKVSQEAIDEAVKLINEKPRRILGYRSAMEMAKKAGIIKSIKSESVLIQG
jgi:transposase, IS30 family